jgi:hypothetical protein
MSQNQSFSREHHVLQKLDFLGGTNPKTKVGACVKTTLLFLSSSYFEEKTMKVSIPGDGFLRLPKYNKILKIIYYHF